MAAGANVEWKPKYNHWLIAVAVMLATFMEVMDTSIASVALPYIAGSISATSDEADVGPDKLPCRQRHLHPDEYVVIT